MGPSSISNTTRRKVYLVSALLAIFSSLTPPLRLLALSGERLAPGEPGDDRHAAPPPDHSQPGSLRPSLAFDNNRLIFFPEYSERTGFSLGASYAIPLTEHTALGLLGSVGADKKEFLVNAGFDLTETQRLIATFGQLRQDMDFDFRSGEERAEMTMSSGALSYQLYLGKGLLNAFEVNGYLADTPSNDLADKTYALDTATLYELWNDPRRVAGGRVTGAQGRLVFAPLTGATFKLGLGGEELEYDYLTGKDTTNRATSSAEWTQQLADGYTVQAGANSMAAMDRYAVGFSRALSGGHRLGVDFANLQGRDGVPDDNQIRLSYSYGFSSGNASAQATTNRASKARLSQAEPAAPPKDTEKPSPAWSAGLLAQVAHRPSFLPSQVVAKIDTTAVQTRLVAINKATLPAGAAIDAATGIITAPLGVAVLSIAGITLNGGPFTNTGQFSLSGGNSIVINPVLITQPAVGITDTYAVTINNVGGGTTVATIQVSHGSVRIDSITVSAGGADITPPTTTAAPSVSSTTDTATTLAATINENGTGYYLVQAAAAAAPDAATVVAANHSFAMTANVQATANIGGLAASTAYTVYFVAKDTAGNTQAAVGSVAVTTNAPAVDTAPNVFTFVDQTNVPLNTVITSGPITVAGINAAASISVTTGEYSINGGAWTNAAGTVNNNATLRVRHTSSGTNSTAVNTTLTIGGVSDVFTTTTIAVDITPPNTPALDINAGATATNNTNINIAITNDTDNIGVTGWYVSESSSVPAIGSFGAKPATVAISAGDGLKTVYVWTRDAAGNVSNVGSDTITLDTILPVTASLPNWGGSVASGSTTAETVEMTDNNIWNNTNGVSMVSITADNGASITGFDNTSYGVNKAFNLVAPVNPGPGAITVAITYTTRDAAGNVNQQVQTVDVAP